MATITHAKVNNIADPTQAELDAQIALGNYPPGTLLADITLPSDWDSNHTFDAAFLELNDTPNSYASQALKVIQVNAGETALEFVALAGGGDALTANPLSQFAATTSLQLKGVISDETGSGALVFADTPTLITPVLGVASATSINGATITSGTLNGTVTGTNTGDQTSIVGISGTKAQFDTAVTDGNFLYVGDAATASFTTIAVSGQSDVVADSSTDTLTLVAGSNITLTTNAGTDTITIAASGGGGGSPAFTIVEKDLGSNPRRDGKFTITGLSGLTIGKPVNISQAVAPYTNKGTLADEAEMDGLVVKAIVTAVDTITAYWNSATRVRGNFKFNYLIGA